MADCPTCGKGFEEHRAADGSDLKPQPGDFTVCAGCAGVAVFDDDLSLRVPRDDETQPAGVEDAQRAVRTYRMLKARMN